MAHGSCRASSTFSSAPKVQLSEPSKQSQIPNFFWAIFKIVPMLNPDGVIIGNYRTGLAGKDLNRQFKQTDKLMYPTISEFKLLLEESKNLFAFLDFHGHSVKKNVFTYGPEFPIFSNDFLKCRLLPKLLSQKTQMFRYWSSIFRVSQSKKRTSRVVFYKKYNILHCFTVESSNGSFYSSQNQQTTDFNCSLWLSMGSIISETLGELVELTLADEMQQLERQQMLLEKHRKQFSYSEEDGYKQSSDKKQSRLKKKQQKGGAQFQRDESKMTKMLEQIRQEEMVNSEAKKEEAGEQEGRSDSESSDEDLNIDELSKLRQEVCSRQINFGNQYVQSARNHTRKKKIKKPKSTSKSFYVSIIVVQTLLKQKSCLIHSSGNNQCTQQLCLAMVGKKFQKEKDIQNEQQAWKQKEKLNSARSGKNGPFLKTLEEENSQSGSNAIQMKFLQQKDKPCQERPTSAHHHEIFPNNLKQSDLNYSRNANRFNDRKLLGRRFQKEKRFDEPERKSPLNLRVCVQERGSIAGKPRITRNQLNNLIYKFRVYIKSEIRIVQEKNNVYNYQYPIQIVNASLINSKATVLEMLTRQNHISKKGYQKNIARFEQEGEDVDLKQHALSLDQSNKAVQLKSQNPLQMLIDQNIKKPATLSIQQRNCKHNFQANKMLYVSQLQQHQHILQNTALFKIIKQKSPQQVIFHQVQRSILAKSHQKKSSLNY